MLQRISNKNDPFSFASIKGNNLVKVENGNKLLIKQRAYFASYFSFSWIRLHSNYRKDERYRNNKLTSLY